MTKVEHRIVREYQGIEEHPEIVCMNKGEHRILSEYFSHKVYYEKHPEIVFVNKLKHTQYK
jgi:hypothetical protein